AYFWKRRRLSSPARRFDRMQWRQGLGPIHKTVNVYIFHSLCLLKYTPPLVPDTIKFLYLRCTYIGAYRIALRSILSYRSNCFSDKKDNSLINFDPDFPDEIVKKKKQELLIQKETVCIIIVI
ncbi:MAG TPA: hypothetical protein VMW09_08535, partial [Desulfatiglandales bacterium]|nr:hypothetical protein [Desulfatiglandales bacterium]